MLNVTWLQGPVPWVKGQARQAKEFLKAFQHVKSFQHVVCYYDIWICALVCTFILFPYTCTYVLKCLCVCTYLFTVTWVIRMTCKRRRLRWWNRFGNRCLCVFLCVKKGFWKCHEMLQMWWNFRKQKNAPLLVSIMSLNRALSRF